MRALTRVIVAAGTGWALLGCAPDEVVRRTTLRFAKVTNPATGDAAMAGFVCTGDRSAGLTLVTSPLLERAVVQTSHGPVLRAALVLDLIHVGGYPRCRGSELLSYCNQRADGCTAKAAERRCIDLPDLPFDASARSSAWTLGATLSAGVESALRGRVLYDDADADPVIVRAVGMAGRCSELADDAPPADEALLGCSYSCPVSLRDGGDVVLDSEALGRCGRQISACAGQSFAPLDLGVTGG